MNTVKSGAPRRKKLHHSLHLARNSEELRAMLGTYGIDLIKLVFEFVKPSVEPGIIVTGSIANGIATEVSDLDVIVLLESLASLKKRHAQVDGVAVNYMPHEDGTRTEVTIINRGIDINLNFIANAQVTELAGLEGAPAARATVNMEDHYQMRFLGRLANCWAIYNAPVVDRWKAHYEIGKFRFNRIATEFTAATKNLEDMRAAVGKGPGCAGILGVSIVSKAMQALLAYNDFCFVSGKWLRKVNQMINESGGTTAVLFEEGRRLLFPGFLATQEAEEGYFGEVQAFCRSIRQEMSRDENLAVMMDGVIEKFDILL